MDKISCKYFPCIGGHIEKIWSRIMVRKFQIADAIQYRAFGKRGKTWTRTNRIQKKTCFQRDFSPLMEFLGEPAIFCNHSHETLQCCWMKNKNSGLHQQTDKQQKPNKILIQTLQKYIDSFSSFNRCKVFSRMRFSCLSQERIKKSSRHFWMDQKKR
eukprot:Sdes_comp20390_c0_seq1m14315